MLEISDLEIGTTYVVITKALIGCAGNMQLICAFVFAYAKSGFPHDMAHMGLNIIQQFGRHNILNACKVFV